MSTPQGQWVVMPANLATGNGGFDLGALLRGRQVDGRMVRDGDNRPRNQQPAIRWQEPDGTLRLLGPGGSRPAEGTRPVPYMTPEQRRGLSAMAAASGGARQAPPPAPVLPPPPAAAPRQQSAAAPRPAPPPAAAPRQQSAAAPRPAPAPAARPAPRPAAAPAQRPQVAPAAPAAPQQVAAAQQNTVPVPAMTPMSWDPTPAGTDDGRAGFGASSRGMPLAGLGGAQPSVGGPNTEGLERDPRYEPDLATRRRAAFLGASDSMSGLKAVRSLLADEAKAQGADISAGGAIPSIRFLEGEIAKRQPTTREVAVADVSENDQAVFKAMEFPGNPITRVNQVSVPAWAGAQEPVAGQMTPDQLKVAYGGQGPAMAPRLKGGQSLPADAVAQGFQRGRDMTSRPYAQDDLQVAFSDPAQLPSGAGRAVIDAYMRDELANKVRQSAPPLNEVAPWQTTGINYAAPRTDPGRDAMLAAFAAQGEAPPSTPGEAFGRLAAAAPLGGRGGQFKLGNSYVLGHVDRRFLPPLGSSGLRISGSGYFENPGNFYG